MGILENKPLQDFLDSQTFAELNWILGRYCGLSDKILFEKKYNYLCVKQQDFKREVERRLFHSLLEEELNPVSDTIK